MLDNKCVGKLFYVALFIYLIAPSTLFAQDDLSGKGIFCYKEDESSARAIGVEFSTKTQAIIYLEENTDPRKQIYTSYKTSAEQVVIKDLSGYYEIYVNRKNLTVETSRQGYWFGKFCIIVEPKELENLFIKSFSKFKQGNIL